MTHPKECYDEQKSAGKRGGMNPSLCDVPDLRQVQNQMDGLNKVLSDTKDRVNILEDRLNGVLRSPLDKEDKGFPVPHLVPLADRIRMLADLANQINLSITSITDRLEL